MVGLDAIAVEADGHQVEQAVVVQVAQGQAGIVACDGQARGRLRPGSAAIPGPHLDAVIARGGEVELAVVVEIAKGHVVPVTRPEGQARIDQSPVLFPVAPPGVHAPGRAVLAGGNVEVAIPVKVAQGDAPKVPAGIGRIDAPPVGDIVGPDLDAFPRRVMVGGDDLEEPVVVHVADGNLVELAADPAHGDLLRPRAGAVLLIDAHGAAIGGGDVQPAVVVEVGGSQADPRAGGGEGGSFLPGEVPLVEPQLDPRAVVAGKEVEVAVVVHVAKGDRFGVTGTGQTRGRGLPGDIVGGPRGRVRHEQRAQEDEGERQEHQGQYAGEHFLHLHVAPFKCGGADSRRAARKRANHRPGLLPVRAIGSGVRVRLTVPLLDFEEGVGTLISL